MESNTPPDNTEEFQDLFETPEVLPQEVQDAINGFGDDFTYDNCDKLLKICESLGYTFEYGLDAIPHGLRKL